MKKFGMASPKAIFDHNGLRLNRLGLLTSEPMYQYVTTANTIYSDVAVICNTQAAFMASCGCFISEIRIKNMKWPA